MKSFRTGQDEITLSMSVKNAIWMITQMIILGEHYLLAEETQQVVNCQEVAKVLKLSINRSPTRDSDHD